MRGVFFQSIYLKYNDDILWRFVPINSNLQFRYLCMISRNVAFKGFLCHIGYQIPSKNLIELLCFGSIEFDTRAQFLGESGCRPQLNLYELCYLRISLFITCSRYVRHHKSRVESSFFFFINKKPFEMGLLTFVKDLIYIYLCLFVSSGLPLILDVNIIKLLSRFKFKQIYFILPDSLSHI